VLLIRKSLLQHHLEKELLQLAFRKSKPKHYYSRSKTFVKVHLIIVLNPIWFITTVQPKFTCLTSIHINLRQKKICHLISIDVNQLKKVNFSSTETTIQNCMHDVGCSEFFFTFPHNLMQCIKSMAKLRFTSHFLPSEDIGANYHNECKFCFEIEN
jgi:hypothetical protein